MQADKNNYLRKTGYVAWYGSLLFFSYLMLLITLQYIPARLDVAFLRVKEDVVVFLHYRISFFAHVYAGMFILLSGMLQFPSYIRRKFPAVHRWSGRVYAYGIILIAGPAGFVMGIYGNGGWISRSAFCVLAVLWIFSTAKGVLAARARQITVHKKWMYRSYALTLSAISLRLWKWLIVLLFAPRPMDVYHVVSWLGWTGNLLIAELIIYFSFRKLKSRVANRSTIPGSNVSSVV
ncbi:MAG TPA: DUF2306 domain-containing protein [Mucilaginibacter sp.]|jgi:uncharacterized membrane protein|nr:DUF2306 domain-containing protein [Mucilaginibacter sp.]